MSTNLLYEKEFRLLSCVCERGRRIMGSKNMNSINAGLKKNIRSRNPVQVMTTMTTAYLNNNGGYIRSKYMRVPVASSKNKRNNNRNKNTNRLRRIFSDIMKFLRPVYPYLYMYIIYIGILYIYRGNNRLIVY